MSFFKSKGISTDEDDDDIFFSPLLQIDFEKLDENSFNIFCQSEITTWEVVRNYEDFLKFNKDLSDYFEVKMPTEFDVTIKETDRIAEIKKYLNFTLADENISKTKLFNSFFRDTKYKTFQIVKNEDNPENPPKILEISSSKRDAIKSRNNRISGKVLSNGFKALSPRLSIPKSPRFEDETGDEKTMEAFYEDFPLDFDEFQTLYSETKGKEFIFLSTNHGTTYYAGEEMIGYIKFNSQVECTPTIMIKCYKKLEYSKDVDNFQSNIFYLNHKIICSKSPCWFKIRIPRITCFGSYRFDTDNFDGDILIKYQIQVIMVPKKNLSNLYGLFMFSSKSNLTIYPNILSQEHNDNYKPSFMINSNEEQNYKKYKLSMKLNKKAYFSDEELKITFSYLNPTGKHEILIHSFHFYLCPQVEIKFKAKKEKETSLLSFENKTKTKTEVFEISKKLNLDKIPLGNLDNHFKNLNGKESSLLLKLPNNSYINDEYFDDLKVNYNIQVVGSLFDYQIKGPTVDVDILISSPFPNSERLSKLKESLKLDDEIISNEKNFTTNDSTMSTLAGMKF
eukprot:gene9834-2156_t